MIVRPDDYARGERPNESGRPTIREVQYAFMEGRGRHMAVLCLRLWRKHTLLQEEWRFVDDHVGLLSDTKSAFMEGFMARLDEARAAEAEVGG